MKARSFLRRKWWLVAVVIAAVCLWLAYRILPWNAASPDEVEAARRNVDRSITMMASAGRPHIAIVVASPEPGGVPWIMHNRGFGPKMEDQLFRWAHTGHYRWQPDAR